MKTIPYELYSIRRARRDKELSDKLNLHPVIVREAYINRWWRCDGSYFYDNVMSGKITREEVIAEAIDFMEMPDVELERRNQKAIGAQKENDFCDIMNYRLKQLIEVGDWLMSDETKTYCFSKKQYQTQGKKYKIISLNDEKANPMTGICAITNSDMKDKRDTIHWCEHGIKSVWRKGKEIWNWNLAYLALHKEQNPNHPQTAQLEEQCLRHAKLMAKGKRTV